MVMSSTVYSWTINHKRMSGRAMEHTSGERGGHQASRGVTLRLLGGVTVAALGLVACGSDDDDGSGGSDTADTAGASSATEASVGSGDAGTGDTADAPGGDQFGVVLAIGSEPTTLDPHIADDGGERAVNDNVYEALTARDASGALVPGLAADMPEQVDETTWRVTLRPEVVFHDGSTLEADDVVATIDRVIALGTESEQYGSFYSTLAGAEAIDESTVEITTTGPDPILPARLYWMKILDSAAVERDDIADHPVGTGPYRFVEYQPGVEVLLEANPDHRDGAPDVDDVTIRFVPEYASRVAGLLSGDYDLITNLAPEDESAAPQAVSVAGLEHPVITLDADDGITADPRVREALNLAVDKQALADALFAGYAELDQGQVLAETHFGFNPDLEPYPYDPEAATALLEEAGVVDETIQLVGTSGRWLKDAETVEAVAGYWENAGLDVDVQILEFGAWLDAWSDREVRPDAVFLNSSNELFDADRTLSALFHRDGIGSSNSDAELGAWIDEARTETDVEAREALYHDVYQRAYDEALQVYLLRVLDSYGLSDRITWQPRVDAKLIVAEMQPAS